MPDRIKTEAFRDADYLLASDVWRLARLRWAAET